MTYSATKTVGTRTMLIGSEGRFDYLIIARNGDVVLGLKPVGLMHGHKMGHPGTVWVGVRLRSARAAVPAEEQGNVVKLQKNPEFVNTAWEGIEWEKINTNRASTTVSAFIPGELDGDPAKAEEFIAKLESGEIADKLVDYLSKLIPDAAFVMPADEIKQWLLEGMKKTAEKLRDALKIKMALKEETASAVGNFGIHASLLKKAYQKVQDSQEVDGDDEDPDDEDEDADEGA